MKLPFEVAVTFWALLGVLGGVHGADSEEDTLSDLIAQDVRNGLESMGTATILNALTGQSSVPKVTSAQLRESAQAVNDAERIALASLQLINESGNGSEVSSIIDASASLLRKALRSLAASTEDGESSRSDEYSTRNSYYGVNHISPLENIKKVVAGIIEKKDAVTKKIIGGLSDKFKALFPHRQTKHYFRNPPIVSPPEYYAPPEYYTTPAAETTTTPAADTTTVGIDTTTEVETTTVEIETTTAEQETTTVEIETTTAEQETTTVEIETTTVLPETTTVEVETTTVLPETTTPLPETTTVEPETTTVEVDTTTVVTETTTGGTNPITTLPPTTRPPTTLPPTTTTSRRPCQPSSGC